MKKFVVLLTIFTFLSIISVVIAETTASSAVSEEIVHKPDLIVKDIIWTPENPKIGETVHISIVVKNIGDANAGRFNLMEFNEKGVNVGKWWIDSLNVGESYTAQGETHFSTSGGYKRSAIVDYDKNIDESNENNNEITKTIYVAQEACYCFGIYAPVCGVDGKTYGNTCEAACAGVEIAYKGECRDIERFNIRLNEVFDIKEKQTAVLQSENIEIQLIKTDHPNFVNLRVEKGDVGTIIVLNKDHHSKEVFGVTITLFDLTDEGATLIVTKETKDILAHLNERFILEEKQSATVVDYKRMKVTLREIYPVDCIALEGFPCPDFRAKVTVTLPHVVTTSKIPEGGVAEAPPSPTSIDLILGEGRSREAFGATITLLDLNSKKATFIVETKDVEDFVDIEIIPRSQTIVYGEGVEYKITIKDKHPKIVCIADEFAGPCIQPLYTYQLDINNLPFKKSYPKSITLSAGQSKTVFLEVMPYTIIRGIPEGEVGAEQYIEKLSKAPAAGKAAETTRPTVEPKHVPPLHKEYRFNARVNLKGDPEVHDIAYAVLNIKPDEKPPITPPTFPGEEVTVKLHRGWNLVSLPGKLVKFSLDTIPSKKLLGYVYLKDENRYVTLKQAARILGKDLKEYLAKNAFWIYSYEDFELNVEIDRELSYYGLALTQGWNLVPVTEDMVGGYLGDILGDCSFEGMYKWNANNQEWVKITENHVFSYGDLNYGFIVKAPRYCRLGGVIVLKEEPSIPVE